MQQSSSLSPSSAGEHRVLVLFSFSMHVLEVGEGVKLKMQKNSDIIVLKNQGGRPRHNIGYVTL